MQNKVGLPNFSCMPTTFSMHNYTHEAYLLLHTQYTHTRPHTVQRTHSAFFLFQFRHVFKTSVVKELTKVNYKEFRGMYYRTLI